MKIGLSYRVFASVAIPFFAGAFVAGMPAQIALAGSAPHVFFTDVESGPASGGPGDLGTPISIFGKGFGQVRGSSRVTIGGVEAASYLVWGTANAHNPMLDMIVVQPGPKVVGGPIVVTVN